MNRWKCTHCDKEVSKNQNCDCKKSKQSWSYITINAVKGDNGYKCICGNSVFTILSHIDFNNSCSFTYQCNKCGNCIGLHFQRNL